MYVGQEKFLKRNVLKNESMPNDNLKILMENGQDDLEPLAP